MPDESKSLSVTLGPREQKVEWHDGQAVPVDVAPLCVRVDHRICDGFQLSQFVSTLIRLLAEPAKMQTAKEMDSANTGPINFENRKTA